MKEYADVSAVSLLQAKRDAVYTAFFSTNERRVGAEVSLGGKFVGTITAIDDSDPLAQRVQLELTGAAFKKNVSRVEVFFRDSGAASALLNVFHDGVKEREQDATQDRWFALFEAIHATVETATP